MVLLDQLLLEANSNKAILSTPLTTLTIVTAATLSMVRPTHIRIVCPLDALEVKHLLREPAAQGVVRLIGYHRNAGRPPIGVAAVEGAQRLLVIGTGALSLTGAATLDPTRRRQHPVA